MAEANPQTINLSKIESIPPKLTVAALNQFIITSVDFINRFAAFSEEKLFNLDTIMDKLDTQLLLLEKKLETLPPEYFSSINQTVSQTQTLPMPSLSSLTSQTPSGPPPPPPLPSGIPPPPPFGGPQTQTPPLGGPPPPTGGPLAPSKVMGGGPPPPPPPPIAFDVLLNATKSGKPIDSLLPSLPPPPPPPPPSLPVLPVQAPSNSPSGDNNSLPANSSEVPAPLPEENKNELPDEYKKYKKLFEMRVPYLAFKNKMIAEGLDPAVFEKFVNV